MATLHDLFRNWDDAQKRRPYDSRRSPAPPTGNSAPYVEAIVSEIDCAVGMSHEIEDGTAIAFAAAFYEVLPDGRTVQTAFELALVQLEGWGTDRSLAKLRERREVKPADVIPVNPAGPSATSEFIAGGRPEVAARTGDHVLGWCRGQT